MTLVPGDPLAHRALEWLLRAETSVRGRLVGRARARGAVGVGLHASSSCSPRRAASSSCARCAAACGPRRPTRPRSSRRSSSAGSSTRRAAAARPPQRGRAPDGARPRRGRPPVPRPHRRVQERLRGPRRGREALAGEPLPQAGRLGARLRSGDPCPTTSARPRGPGRPPAVLPRARGAGARSAGASATSSASRCAAARAPRRGSSTRGRRPPTAGPARTTCSRASSRTSTRASGRCAGYLVERKGGWDCHGLPVEIAVERELGIASKAEIEAYGIAEFNAQCRESVFTYLEEWNALTERIGFWLDLDDAYRTLDPSYIESVWWALRQICDKGLLYEGHKVVPYCPALRDRAVARTRSRSATSDVVDPSIYVRFPVAEDGGPLQAGDELLVWTTTPWTLVSNAAVAVDPELTYVRAKAGALERAGRAGRGARRARARRGRDVEVLDRFPGAALDGVRYEPPFPLHRRRRRTASAATPSCSATSSPPTTAPASSTRRSPSARTTSASAQQLRPGRRQPGRGRRHLRRAHRPLRRALRQGRRPGPDRGPRAPRAAAARRGATSTPTRTAGAAATPLLYYAKPSWYIATSQLRDRLLAANETVDWHPSTSSTGASATGCENNVDWALSRERYWGTPLPVWRCERRATSHVVGSFDELEELSGVRLEDPHRPYVDEVGFPCPQCHGRMRRVPEVIDVWFDSGCDAVRAGARAVRARGALRARASRPTSSARRSTRRAAGSTRCWRSRRCCSTARPTSTSSASA